MNLGIFLRQFKKSNEEIIAALKEGNSEVLSQFCIIELNATLQLGCD